VPFHLHERARVLSSLSSASRRGTGTDVLTAAGATPVAGGSRSGSPRGIEFQGARPRDPVKPLALRPDHVKLPFELRSLTNVTHLPSGDHVGEKSSAE